MKLSDAQSAVSSEMAASILEAISVTGSSEAELALLRLVTDIAAFYDYVLADFTTFTVPTEEGEADLFGLETDGQPMIGLGKSWQFNYPESMIILRAWTVRGHVTDWSFVVTADNSLEIRRNGDKVQEFNGQEGLELVREVVTHTLMRPTQNVLPRRRRRRRLHGTYFAE